MPKYRMGFLVVVEAEGRDERDAQHVAEDACFLPGDFHPPMPYRHLSELHGREFDATVWRSECLYAVPAEERNPETHQPERVVRERVSA